MISAVDSSVILDVLTADSTFADSSERRLRQAGTEGRLVVCECVLVEIYPAFERESDFELFLDDWQLEFVATSRECAMVAGRFFASYLLRKTEATRVLPDFLIAAHALTNSERLLARDRGYLRDYFKKLKVLSPV
jgi:predicted nucleic acid-binding protein